MTAIQTYEQKLATVSDPYARESLQYMIQEERRQLLNLADLVDIVEQSPDMGRLSRARKRMAHQIRMNPGAVPHWVWALPCLARLCCRQ